MRKSVILSVDTGIDDATAIVLAFFQHNLDVKALLSAKGNSSINESTNNTIGVMEYIGKCVPVFKGLAKPLKPTVFKVAGVHGKGGIGGFVFPKRKTEAQSFEKLEEFISKQKRKVTIISTAPLTNLATLLENAKCKKKIKQIIIQAGLLSDPNYTSFNVATDPFAMEKVLQSGVKIIICPSDMGHFAFLGKKDVADIKHHGKTGEMLVFMFRSYKDRVVQNNVATHDSCAVACLARPKIFTFKKAHVFVEFNEKNIGILKFDFENKQPNATVCTDINIRQFKKLLFNAISKAP